MAAASSGVSIFSRTFLVTDSKHPLDYASGGATCVANNVEACLRKKQKI